MLGSAGSQESTIMEQGCPVLFSVEQSDEDMPYPESSHEGLTCLEYSNEPVLKTGIQETDGGGVDKPLQENGTSFNEGVKPFYLKDLNYSQRRDLAKLLDPQRDHVGNWEDLAYTLKMEKMDILKLRCNFAGVSEPCRNFLYSFQHSNPNVSVRELRNTLEEEKRLDVCSWFDQNGIASATLIRDFFRKQLDDLAVVIGSATDKVSAGWETLASRYGYSMDEIRLLGTVGRRLPQSSPTMGLIEILEAHCPRTLLAEIREASKLLQRNDVVDKLDDFIVKHYQS